MTFPRAYGGTGGPAVERFVVVEELLAHGAPVAAHWIADRQTGPLLLKYGSEAQRRRFLPAIARGECYFAIGMSEPDAGSDLASIRTAATMVDGGWRLQGAKIWTSHAHRSHFSIVLCRTSPPGDRPYEGMSQLILDLQAPGVTIRPIRAMTGEPHFCEMHFEDAFVPDDMLIGEAGQGWAQVMSELAYERSGPERFLSTYPLFAALVDELGSRPDARGAEVVGRLASRRSSVAPDVAGRRRADRCWRGAGPRGGDRQGAWHALRARGDRGGPIRRRRRNGITSIRGAAGRSDLARPRLHPTRRDE